MRTAVRVARAHAPCTVLTHAAPAQPTTSFHSIFAFGEGPVNRMRDLPKGYVPTGVLLGDR